MGIVIGISGRIGSGKSTLASLLINKLRIQGIQAEEKAFAGKLKEITSILSGLPLSDMYSQEGKNKLVTSFGMTVGQMQQKIGTEVFRDTFDTDTWIKALFNGYDKTKDVWIITDMRFSNELQAIIDSGPHSLIRLNGDPLRVRENSNRDLNHPSETSLDDCLYFDYEIDNSIPDIGILHEHANEIVGDIVANLVFQSHAKS